MRIYVNKAALSYGDGSAEHPFRTIQEAANIAIAGDEVIVAPGIYREYVNPKNAGREDARIVYRAETPRTATIAASEVVTDWEQVEGSVYKTTIPNAVFNGSNPYTTLVCGDWLNAAFVAHTGEIFLNGKAMFEVATLQEVMEPKVYPLTWDPEGSLYAWYTEQDTAADATILYANFRSSNPAEETVEISVRQNCFYPANEHVDYITLSGFVVRDAATQWAPPTALQDGMIGPHWSKGWTIEDCEIYNSKCSGISLGKYLQPGDNNKWSEWKYKDGTQTQRECVMRAMREGWSKETVGSHLIRRCDIHDCGQTGIVGHLGGVFSTIENNHIYRINNRQNLSGAEIGGIKMHAAIDVTIRHNHFDHCTRGLWLDWEAQGTRVTGNLFHDNTLPNDANLTPENGAGLGEDVFIEVSHGPTLVDNNIFLSDFNLKLPTQGVCFVHNLFAGSITAVCRGVNNGSKSIVSPRYTPYHVPHGTDVANFMTILHGDMQFYNNIFIQKPVRPGIAMFEQIAKEDVGAAEWTDNNTKAGTIPFEDFPTLAEWQAQFEGYCGQGSPMSDRYYSHLPVWTDGNVYCNGAQHITKEQNFSVIDVPVTLSLEESEDGYQLQTNLYKLLPKTTCVLRGTSNIAMAFEPEQRYENPDGSPLLLNEDILGNRRSVNPLPGPFACGDEVSEVLFKD